MWCPKCQADVAAKASRDPQRLCCASCGTPLAVNPADTRPANSPRNPRELLARWAEEDAQQALDPLLRIPSDRLEGDTAASPEDHQRRFDASHSPRQQSADPRQPLPASPPELSTDEAAREESPEAPRLAVYDDPVESVVSLPRHPSPVELDGSGRWMAFVGQLFAYAGVGTLTVGAVLVILGYFGGRDNYAPTGWLVATAGQMLLFLGVVTLISAGLEQTTHEVARRIDNLGIRIGRLERRLTAEKPSRSPKNATVSPEAGQRRGS